MGAGSREPKDPRLYRTAFCLLPTAYCLLKVELPADLHHPADGDHGRPQPLGAVRGVLIERRSGVEQIVEVELSLKTTGRADPEGAGEAGVELGQPGVVQRPGRDDLRGIGRVWTRGPGATERRD